MKQYTVSQIVELLHCLGTNTHTHTHTHTQKKTCLTGSVLLRAKLNTLTTHQQTLVNSLVGFLPVGPAGSGPTVVGLDYKGILLLALTVHGATGPQDSFS